MNEVITDPIIDFFVWHTLHDTPITSLHFHFENQSVIWVLDCYDDIAKQDAELRLVFKKVSKFLFDYPADEFVFDMRAVYSAKIHKLTETLYELEALIDMPEIKETHGKQREWVVGKMLIGFVDLEVIGGLSREAMEYKWREEE